MFSIGKKSLIYKFHGDAILKERNKDDEIYVAKVVG